MDVGGFWRSPKKVIIEDSPCHFYPSRNRSVQGKNPTKTPPSLSYHHAPQIQVLGERPVNFMHGGNSSFWVSHRLEWFWTVFLCIVMWSASNKKHPSVSYFSQQCDLTFQVWSSILPQVWGIFPFFLGQRSTFSKTQPDGPGLWLEAEDAVSSLRNTNPKKPCFFRFGEEKSTWQTT